MLPIIILKSFLYIYTSRHVKFKCSGLELLILG